MSPWEGLLARLRAVRGADRVALFAWVMILALNVLEFDLAQVVAVAVLICYLVSYVYWRDFAREREVFAEMGQELDEHMNRARALGYDSVTVHFETDETRTDT